MMFSIVFGGMSSNSDYPRPTYHLVFHPSPIWMIDSVDLGSDIDDYDRATINPGQNPENKGEGIGPEYRIGYLQTLMLKEGLNPELNPNAVVCVQPGGNGTEKDLETLLEDLQNSKFETTVVRL